MHMHAREPRFTRTRTMAHACVEQALCVHMQLRARLLILCGADHYSWYSTPPSSSDGPSGTKRKPSTRRKAADSQPSMWQALSLSLLPRRRLVVWCYGVEIGNNVRLPSGWTLGVLSVPGPAVILIHVNLHRA